MSPYKAFSASVIGTSHTKNNLPCHDSHLVRTFNEAQSLIATVSDGMGSAKHADIGSALATECVVDYLEENLAPTDDDETVIATIKDAFKAVYHRLEEEAETQAFELRDLNATLMVFIALEPGRQFGGQVGDCITIGREKDESAYEIAIAPQKGEYVNQTFSVCNLDSIEDGHYFAFETSYEKVAMMSDGIESFTINSATEDISSGFFDPFFDAFDKAHFTEEKASQSLQAFLNTDRVNKRTDDDKTLVFIRITPE